MKERVHYIDNLRWLTVSLLIIYHAAIAYNTWGEANYIFFEEVRPLSFAVTFISPWFMPLMFLLAGASARFSLEKRGYAAFIRERFARLGIPFLFGVLAIAPILSYAADVTHNGYEGGYLSHYAVFFSRFTDLTGYDGGFTLGHFWFLGVLIIVSLLSCAVIKAGERIPEARRKTALTAAGIVLSVAAVGAADVRLFGKQIVTCFCVYLLGYYFVSSREFTAKLARFGIIFTAVFLISSAADAWLFSYTEGFGGLNTALWYAATASALPALICLGHSFLDRANDLTKRFSRISYMFYILHFPIVILCQYYLGRAGLGSIAGFILTVLISYPLTYVFCAAADRTRYLKVLLGSKAAKK